MLDYGDHTPFILAAYGISFVVLIGLVTLAIKRNRD